MNIKNLLKALRKFDSDTIISGVSTEFRSYRGYYEHLAMSPNVEYMPVEVFCQALEDQIGKTFTGFKGGEYTVHESTELFVASYERTGEGVIGVRLDDGELTLTTEKDRY